MYTFMPLSNQNFLESKKFNKKNVNWGTHILDKPFKLPQMS